MLSSKEKTQPNKIAFLSAALLFLAVILLPKPAFAGPTIKLDSIKNMHPTLLAAPDGWYLVTLVGGAPSNRLRVEVRNDDSAITSVKTFTLPQKAEGVALAKIGDNIGVAYNVEIPGSITLPDGLRVGKTAAYFTVLNMRTGKTAAPVKIGKDLSAHDLHLVVADGAFGVFWIEEYESARPALGTLQELWFAKFNSEGSLNQRHRVVGYNKKIERIITKNISWNGANFILAEAFEKYEGAAESNAVDAFLIKVIKLSPDGYIDGAPQTLGSSTDAQIASVTFDDGTTAIFSIRRDLGTAGLPHVGVIFNVKKERASIVKAGATATLPFTAFANMLTEGETLALAFTEDVLDPVMRVGEPEKLGFVGRPQFMRLRRDGVQIGAPVRIPPAEHYFSAGTRVGLQIRGRMLGGVWSFDDSLGGAGSVGGVSSKTGSYFRTIPLLPVRDILGGIR